MLDRASRTELHYAAKEDNVSRIDELIAAGADVNAYDVNFYTPLHMAAQEFAVSAASRLIELGANLAAQDSMGNTPLFVSVYRSRGRGEMVSLLLEMGSNPDTQNFKGNSPRSLAHQIANFDVAKFFG